MMIFKLILILFTILSSKIVYGQKQKVYLNYIPYTNSECSGDVQGVGFSALLDSCFSFDYKINWNFERSTQSGNEIYVSKYNDINGTLTCNEESFISKTLYMIDSCIIGGDSVDFQSTLISLLNNVHYKLSISYDSPIIPSKTYSTIYTYGNNQCEPDNKLSNQNIIMSTFFTNNTKVADGTKNNVFSFYCDAKNQPTLINCINGKCLSPYITTDYCEKTSPFFNSSSESSSSSSNDSSDYIVTSSGQTAVASSSTSMSTGISTGQTGTGSQSGSCSGSGSGSSGTGSTSVDSNATGFSAGGLVKIKINSRTSSSISHTSSSSHSSSSSSSSSHSSSSSSTSSMPTGISSGQTGISGQTAVASSSSSSMPTGISTGQTGISGSSGSSGVASSSGTGSTSVDSNATGFSAGGLVKTNLNGHSSTSTTSSTTGSSISQSSSSSDSSSEYYYYSTFCSQ